MKYPTRIYYTESDKGLMWDRWEKGESGTPSQNSSVFVPLSRQVSRYALAIGIGPTTDGFRNLSLARSRHAESDWPWLDARIAGNDSIHSLQPMTPPISQLEASTLAPMQSVIQTR